MISFMVLTASRGYLPEADSADNMTASTWSKTALATSEVSALVGLGFSVMDSSIWVATIIGRLYCLASFIIFCWIIGTSAAGVSIAKSPLATMTASDAKMISSRFLIASFFSILVMILAPDLCFLIKSLAILMTSRFWTKDNPK